MSTADVAPGKAVTSPTSFHHSPRSSVDSPRTPTSPFLHNLSTRFRKSSNASTHSMRSNSPAHQHDPADRAETAQSAKRFLLSVIRNDWEWPPPQPSTASEGAINTPEEHKPASIMERRDPVGWRTRQEGASDIDLDIAAMTATKRKSKRASDPYRFENPDAIGEMFQQNKRKRKRQQMEEMKWNVGLRAWVEQRDAWTAAVPHKPIKGPVVENGERRRGSIISMRQKNSNSSEETKTSSSAQESTAAEANDNQSTPNWPLPKNTDGIESLDTVPASEDAIDGPYLPIYPPLFPTSHTLRSRIKPAAYPTIYSKVVVQSLTPNVPIPLTHMINALVDGWKAEGNWPPQTLAEQREHAIMKRAKGNKKNESAFQKWRRDRETDRRNQQGMIDDMLQQEEMSAEDEKKGFRRSISGAVRKVFGIHGEVEEDGGLSKLGLSFAEGNDGTEGLMQESAQVAADNVLLNKDLLVDNR